MSAEAKHIENVFMHSAIEDLDEYLAETLAEDNIGGVEVSSARTFEDMGVMTNDKGFVLRLSDGSEFQLTILQTK